MTNGAPPAADVARPLVEALLGGALPVRIEFWDGSVVAPEAGPPVRRHAAHPLARRAAPDPVEPQRARARPGLRRRRPRRRRRHLRADRGAPRRRPEGPAVSTSGRPLTAAATVAAPRRLGVLGRPLPPPPAGGPPAAAGATRLRRDAEAISHHYDVGNDFYRIVLGPSMTYSCARFVDDDTDARRGPGGQARPGLPQARARTSAPGVRLLDVGCGWGSMAIHAAQRTTARRSSASRSAASRPSWPASGSRGAGVDDRVEIRLQDYRELGGERFDAITSIGMSEHVGAKRARRVLRRRCTRRWCRRAGCSTTPSRRWAARSSAGTSFIGRYVFPDGELIDVGDTVLAMERGRLRGPRRRVAARALRPHAAGLGRQPRGELGRRGRRRRRRHGRGSGGCTWPGRRSASPTAGSPSTRCSASCPTPEGTSAMPPTRAHWL